MNSQYLLINWTSLLNFGRFVFDNRNFQNLFEWVQLKPKDWKQEGEKVNIHPGWWLLLSHDVASLGGGNMWFLSGKASTSLTSIFSCEHSASLTLPHKCGANLSAEVGYFRSFPVNPSPVMDETSSPLSQAQETESRRRGASAANIIAQCGKK